MKVRCVSVTVDPSSECASVAVRIVDVATGECLAETGAYPASHLWEAFHRASFTVARHGWTDVDPYLSRAVAT